MKVNGKVIPLEEVKVCRIFSWKKIMISVIAVELNGKVVPNQHTRT